MRIPPKKYQEKLIREKLGRVLLLVILAVFLAPEALLAKKKDKEDAVQTHCRVNIEYSWKRKILIEDEEKGNTETLGEAQSFLFDTLEARAQTEKEAKELLDLRVIDAKQRAIQQCRQRHESISACVSSKYDALQTVLSRLDFSARSTLQESVRIECEQQSGVCESITTQDPECFVPGPPIEVDEKTGKKK